MLSSYDLRVFLICVIKLDPELEPLIPSLDRMHILLNNMGQDNHVPEAERFVRTTKDSCHAGFTGTPSKKLPIKITIGIFLIVIFWNNYVAAEDGVSQSISPKGIINSAV